MDFKQLQSFVEVVKQNSFTKAAEILFLSQPTVSTHVQQLEAELNTRLIIRTTKSTEITPKGRELFEYALNILNLRDRMLQSCSADSQKIVHVGASTIPSAYILPEILPAFSRQSGDVYFVIHQDDSGGIIKGLMDGLFDIGLIGMNPGEESIECVPFCEDRMVIITPVSKRFLVLQQKEDTPVRELLKEPIILREKGSGSKKSAEQFLEALGIDENDLTIAARINDQEAIKNLVSGGLGVSIISERAAENFFRSKRILKFPLEPYVNPRKLFLAYRREFIMRKEIREFIKFVKNYYA